MPGTIANEPPRSALSIAMLADDDLSIIVTTVASSNDHGMIARAVKPLLVSTMTNKLADDDPIIEADNPGAVIVATAVKTDANDATIIVDLPTATVLTATLADDDPTIIAGHGPETCLLYTSPSPRDGLLSRMPSSA